MMKTMIAWFSWSGCCQVLAEGLAKKLGADMFHIETMRTYSSVYAAAVVQAGAELMHHARPRLAVLPGNMSSYDEIILIYPIWWNTCPMGVFTFLEYVDTAGKTIRPICCHKSTGLIKSVGDIRKFCPAADVKDGVAVKHKEARQAETIQRLLDYVGKQ